MPHQTQDAVNTAHVDTGPAMVEKPEERIIIELLERHYCSLSNLDDGIKRLEVKLEPVTKASGIRRDEAEKCPPPIADGWNDDSSKITRMVGEMGQRIIMLSGRISVLTDNLET